MRPGTGTGNVARHLLSRLPECALVCLDGSPDMIAVARRRLRRHRRVRFLQRDFGRAAWTKDLPPLDAVVSFGAVHHLDRPGKKRLFSQIRELLRPGGIFLCADPVRGTSAPMERRYEEAWVRLIKANLARINGDSPSLASIRRRHRRLQREDGDRPSPLPDQLEWLRQARFHQVDCHWKRFGFALFGGVR